MSGVPNNIIVPFVGMSFDATGAAPGPSTLPFQALAFGQTNAGTATDIVNVSSADAVGQLAGYGSQLHRLALKWFLNNSFTSFSVVALADAGASTASTTVVTIGGVSTEGGVPVSLLVDGDLYAGAAPVGATATDIGANLATEINEDVNCAVTAASVSGVVTLTAKTKGLEAGLIPVELNYNDGERLPAGVTATVGAPTPGGGTPDIAAALAKIGGSWFQVFVGPYNDTTNLDLIETFLLSRADVLTQQDGMYYTGITGTRSEVMAAGADANRNNQFVSMYACSDMPNSISGIVGAIAGQTSASVQDDPAVPLHRMTLQGIKALKVGKRWTLVESNQVAQSYIATLTHDNGVQTQATVTMYARNAAGANDVSYQYQNTIFILQRLRYRFVNRILTRYPRAKLADNAQRIRTDQQVMTPTVGRAEALSWFLEEELDGQVENFKEFKKALTVWRPTDNVNRMNWGLPVDLINQFLIGSAVANFKL